MRTLAALSALILAVASLASAQDREVTIRIDPSRQRPEVRQLPRDVADEVIRTFNAPGTVRFSGMTRIPPARGIDGDVAVLGGPVEVAGRVSGSITVINGDLVLEQGAVIGGDVLVVGGEIEGQRRARITGEVRSYPSVLRYRRTGDQLVYAPDREALRRFRRPPSDSRTNFDIGLDGTYNRVEGVPIVMGPGMNLRLGDGARLQGDARLILRSGQNFSLDDGRFGYRARAELVVGQRTSNVGFGVRAYDQVTSVETWPLRDYEAGWASFLLHDDYRDWYRRRGAALYAAVRPSRVATLTVEGRWQDVFSADTAHPWTLFNNSRSWRVNPGVTDGRYRSLVAGLKVDTRNDRGDPSSGVLVSAEYEAGEGTDITGTIDPTIVCIQAPCVPASYADGKLTYQRAWFDARLYTRFAPAGRLNLRLVGGGKVGGDDLPLQNRVSLGSPDPLPGYPFRYLSCGGENLPGTPALCDRVIVAQAELRTHMGFDFGPDWANMWGENSDEPYEPFHVSGPDIVVFADAGYAWNVGSAPGALPSGSLPALHLWQPDVGIGLDMGPIGLYLAKALGPANNRLTFTVRMGRRF